MFHDKARSITAGFRPGRFHLAALLIVAACGVLLPGCSVFADLAPSNPDTKNVTDWLVVPVYYVTNRIKDPSSKRIDYLEELKTRGRNYGVKNMVIPFPREVKIDQPTMDRMGWQFLHIPRPLPAGKRPEIPQATKIADKEMTGVEITNEVAKYRADSGSDEVVIFVHGCCATFDTSLERGAKIAANMQLPLVVYDWVSPKGFTRYLENETLAEESLDDFYALLERIEQVLPPKYTTLIGHSMGAHFLDSVLVRRFERKSATGSLTRYREVLFSNGDIDAQSYINHNRQIAGNAEKVRVFVSPIDGRLKTSAMAHGEHSRLGRPEELLPFLCNIEDQDIVDISDVGMGHEMPFWLVADLHRTGKPDSQEGFDWITRGKHYFIVRKREAASGGFRKRLAQNDACDCNP